MVWDGEASECTYRYTCTCTHEVRHEELEKCARSWTAIWQPPSSPMLRQVIITEQLTPPYAAVTAMADFDNVVDVVNNRLTHCRLSLFLQDYYQYVHILGTSASAVTE